MVPLIAIIATDQLRDGASIAGFNFVKKFFDVPADFGVPVAKARARIVRTRARRLTKVKPIAERDAHSVRVEFIRRCAMVRSEQANRCFKVAPPKELRIARAIGEGTERAFEKSCIGINYQRTNPIMLDHNDLKWIASTSTDLNSILQQIARYCDLARRHKGEHNYIDLLGERVELAAKTAQGLFDRITTKILASATGKAVPPGSPPVATAKGVPAFSVMPPPVRPVAQQVVRTVAALHGNKEPDSSRAKTAIRANGKIPSEIKIKNPKGNREYLLVIEDEVEVADLAGEMLAEEGYKVILAHDGFEALKIYEKIGERIGLVILDFFLPVMDGDAVFDELRGLNPDIAVVLSSGFAEQSKIGAMLAQGLRGFIPKPYTREKLLEQVRSTLDAARETSRRD